MLGIILKTFNRHPISVPIISAGLLSIVGDSISQHAIEKKPFNRHDYSRTSRLALYGLFIIGPASCLWLRFLDRVIIHPHNGIRTLKRVLVDQAFFAPTFLGVFFFFNHITENFSLSGLKSRFKSSYFDALIANYKLWPAVQVINFYFIPLNYQLLFLNFIAIGWTAFLSNANQKASEVTKSEYKIIEENKIV